MGQQITVTLPDIGDFKDVEIIELLVSPGDTVAEEDSILTLETDKATMEIPCPQAGVVEALQVQVGGIVNQGDPILTLRTEEAATEATPAAAPATIEPSVAPVTAPEPIAEVSGEAQSQPIHIPDVGDFKDVEVVEILVRPGDACLLYTSPSPRDS